ncbi:MAG: TetR family transcriptional regulator [Ruminiclostridium sp.]|nr:TetR family transcriptional regulator [Ruminiclostridium sp.]
MNEKPVDRRTLKTKKLIRDALAVLMTDRELQKVTVKDITDLADINRGTFYKHYLDVYDLYENPSRKYS